MAKKSRRARRRRKAESRRRPSPPAVASPKQVAVEGAKSPAAPGSSSIESPSPRKQVDFSAEYHYVISDLRNMGIIAIAMLAVLIALSFVIR